VQQVGSSEIYVTTFGSFSLAKNGRQIRFDRAKDRALLAFLSTNRGRTYRRDYLADLLWPDSTAIKSKHCLSQALYSIRRSVPTLIQADKTQVCCTVYGVKTDVDEFLYSLQRADIMTASALLRGPFLDDLVNLNSAPFNEWRDRCHAKFFSRFEQAVMGALDSLSTDDANTCLAEIQSKVGDLLSPNLGVHQMNRSRAAAKQQDAAQSFNTRRDSTVKPDELPFIGRSQELQLLNEALSSCETGKSEYVLVGGNPGYGKTNLVKTFIQSVAAQSTKFIQCRCYESEKRFGFGPILQILDKNIDASDLADLEPIWRSALSQVLPMEFAGGVPLPELGAAAGQARFFEAILRLFDGVARRTPIILFLDDLQWCDNSTRTLLSYLTHRLVSARILVIGAIRSTNAQAQLQSPWKEWKQLFLEDFTPLEVEEFVKCATQAHGVKLPTWKSLVELCGGHPYLTAELIRLRVFVTQQNVPWWPGQRGAKNVESHIQSVLNTLSRRHEDVLRALAVIGRPANVELIAQIIGSSRTGSPIDDLISSGLLHIVNRRVAFRHDLIRESVYRKIPPVTRMDLHFRSAKVLKISPKRVGETAGHYYKARKRQLALKYALKAIEAADAEHANDEAIYFTKLALRTSDNNADRLRLNLAERLSRAHRLAEAQLELKKLEVHESKLEVNDRVTARLLRLELAVQQAEMDSKSVLQAILEREKELARTSPLLLHRALRLQMRCAYNAGDQELIQTSINELRKFAADYKDLDASVEALAFAARAYSTVYSSHHALAIANDIWPRLGEISNHELRIRIMTALGGIEYEAGNIVESQGIFERALDDVRNVGAMNMWPTVATHAHMLLVEQGQYEKAQALQREVETRAHWIEDPYTLAVLHANTAWMMYESGDFVSAKERANAAIPSAKRSGWAWIELGLTGILGLCAVKDGYMSEARKLSEYGADRLSILGRRISDTSFIELLIARTSFMLGRRQTALARLQSAIEEYGDREAVCRLRMRLEFASILKHVDKQAARREARDVFDIARRINTLPIAERADSLLRRL
jgi:tetratricopeptide (TPR) repeat protein